MSVLEQDDSDSIIVAATDPVSMLDEALFRRFDDVIRYVRARNIEFQEPTRYRFT